MRDFWIEEDVDVEGHNVGGRRGGEGGCACRWLETQEERDVEEDVQMQDQRRGTPRKSRLKPSTGSSPDEGKE